MPLQVRSAGIRKGRGVYCTRDIDEGEIVEVCPVLLFPGPHKDLPESLQSLTFCWGFLVNAEECQALALGYGSLYNSANPANLTFSADVALTAIRLVAARRIQANEELTINYSGEGGSAVSDEDHWFQSRGMVPEK